MPIAINNVGNSLPIPPVAEKPPADGASQGSFQNMLSGAMSSLDKLQTEADATTAKLVSGQPVELHEVLLATEKASLGFQLVVQVRNKIVEAYQDVMRMQV